MEVGWCKQTSVHIVFARVRGGLVQQEKQSSLNCYNRGHNLLIKIQFFPMIFRIVTPFRILCVMPPFPPTMLADKVWNVVIAITTLSGGWGKSTREICRINFSIILTNFISSVVQDCLRYSLIFTASLNQPPGAVRVTYLYSFIGRPFEFQNNVTINSFSLCFYTFTEENAENYLYSLVNNN